jgi:DNA-binding NtrC family response regulator
MGTKEPKVITGAYRLADSDNPPLMLPELVGSHPAIETLRRRIPKLAAEDTRLVVVGESGVGKSLFVAHIHKQSSRGSLPLKSVDMSLLKERYQRILLLGGGFPELTTTRRSVLEYPTTVLIKHIDCANPYLQDRLADALTTMEIRRPGRNDRRPVTSRVVFALRRNPSVLHRSGRITPSLHSILRTCRRVQIPPLRRRTEDIPRLTEYYLPEATDPSLVDALRQHQWRGNVLELKAFLRSIVVRSHEEALREFEKQQLEKMIMLLEEGGTFSLQRSLGLIADGILERALSKTGGNYTKAARLLGLTESTVRRRLSSSIML